MHQVSRKAQKAEEAYPAKAAGKSLVRSLLMPAVPLLALLLAATAVFATYGVQYLIEHEKSRNEHMQAGSISLALQQVLMETRNNLLILAAGSMTLDEMSRRLSFRSKTENLFYREVAFLGRTPENRYLLLNVENSIITVPPQVARDATSGPFHTVQHEQRPGHVSVSAPLEVNYTMVPVGKGVRNLTYQVVRFSTPVYDNAGMYQGMLVLSLDLRALRNTMSRFTPPNMMPEAARAGQETQPMRSLFFDSEGWMLFQSEAQAGAKPHMPLCSDAVRVRLQGDFGRPGFTAAFRPAAEYLSYWSMVAGVQAGRSGHEQLSGSMQDWSKGLGCMTASYAPVIFRSGPDAEPVVLGGVIMAGSEHMSTGLWIRALLLAVIFLLVILLPVGYCLWKAARSLSGQARMLSTAIGKCNTAVCSATMTVPSQEPLRQEYEQIRQQVDGLLLQWQKIYCQSQEEVEQKKAQAQREPLEDFPLPHGQVAHCLVGQSPLMLALHAQIEKAAAVSANVLVLGETGTGKEMVSQAIHSLSDRADGPFISINCGALDEALLMDTLFGHVKGAFTEAKQSRKGAFLAAEGGTLMLDEVGNAAPKVQQALLRALSTRRIRPLGADQDVPFDTRIIAATNADLRSSGMENSFRNDLYYRLAVITITVPPLRQRMEDIPLLVAYFMAEAVSSHAGGMPAVVPKVSRGALEKLTSYQWPGNVRELRNTVIRALTFCDGDILLAEHMHMDAVAPAPVTSEHVRQSEPTAPQTMRNGEGSSRGTAMPADQPDSAGPTDVVPAAGQNDLPPAGAASCQPATWAALNARQRAVLHHLEKTGSISRHEYQSMLAGDISMRTAQYDLQQLVQLGVVRTQGRGPSLRYVLVPASAQTVRANTDQGDAI